jgi:hypothetical protein
MADAAPPVRRFYQQAAVGPDLDIRLDGKPVKTPGRRGLILPNARLAEAIADEWNAQQEAIDPRAMPLTGLANAAIDRIAPDCATFAASLAEYGEGDLLYYRVDEPAALATRQRELWDPILGWAQQRYDAVFELATGVVHMPQPPETVARLARRPLAPGYDLGLAPDRARARRGRDLARPGLGGGDPRRKLAGRALGRGRRSGGHAGEPPPRFRGRLALPQSVVGVSTGATATAGAFGTNQRAMIRPAAMKATASETKK